MAWFAHVCGMRKHKFAGIITANAQRFQICKPQNAPANIRGRMWAERVFRLSPNINTHNQSIINLLLKWWTKAGTGVMSVKCQ